MGNSLDENVKGGRGTGSVEAVRVVAVEVLERVSESSTTFDAKTLLLCTYSATCCRRVWMRSVSSEGGVGCAGRGGSSGSVACNGMKGGLVGGGRRSHWDGCAWVETGRGVGQVRR